MICFAVGGDETPRQVMPTNDCNVSGADAVIEPAYRQLFFDAFRGYV